MIRPSKNWATSTVLQPCRLVSFAQTVDRTAVRFEYEPLWCTHRLKEAAERLRDTRYFMRF